MKHLIFLMLLCVGCGADGPEPSALDSRDNATRAASRSGSAGTAATQPFTPASAPSATATVPRAPTSRASQPSAAGASAPATSTQPSAAGASAPATSTQPSAAGASAPTTSTQPSAAGASAPAMTTPLCEVLERCCPALPDPTLRATCEGVASARAESACANVTSMLCADGSTTSASCDDLSTCCASLEDEDQEDCQSLVEEADPPACGEALAELCPGRPTTPGTTSDDCPELMICCMSLSDSEDQEECEEVVADADAAACAESLAELCPDPNAPAPPESDD